MANVLLARCASDRFARCPNHPWTVPLMARAQNVAPEPAVAERWNAEPKWRERALEILARADIQVGGPRPWDIEVHDPRTWHRAQTQGNLGLAEAYMEGWWGAAEPDAFFARLLGTEFTWGELPSARGLVSVVRSRLVPARRGRSSPAAAEHHHELGLDLFQRMYGKHLTSVTGAWAAAKSLPKAQEHRFRLIAQKLGLRKGMRLLEIGTEWGAFAAYAARRHGVQVVALTNSREQAEHARVRAEGLDVDIRLGAHTTLGGESFDRVVSLHHLERLPAREHGTFFEVCHDATNPGGLLFLQSNIRRTSSPAPDSFTQKYVLPTAHVPSLQQVSDAAEGRFVVEDLHNIRTDADRTVMAWHANVRAHWKRLHAEYGDAFGRMWDYHLLSTAGAHRAGRLQCHEIVFARDRGLAGGYTPVR